MKKIFLLLVATSLMAFQCEKDPIYENIYKIQNNSSYDLILITDEEEVIIEKPAESNSEHNIVQVSDSYSLKQPSENVVFSKITLYREDSNGNRFLTYEQEPILDELWTLDTSAGYGIESPNYNVWVLSITNTKLN
ncbi:hypothetical protein [Maribacter antarcticus]|uniref:hypothetical protein n=1 Tax=Maribacter antarcticus TaxID=505250 RepID=UPI00047E9469|nr:hypothetical protein [Maribacter antarcticus]